MRNSFIFYRSFFEAIKEFDNNTKAEIYDAICEFSLNQTEPKLSGASKAVFILIKPQIEANLQRFENGKKGGRPKTKQKPKENQKKTKQKPNVNVNVDDNVNVNVDVKKEKNIKKKKNTYGEFEKVKLADDEVEKLKQLYTHYFDDAVAMLDTYLASKGDKYKSHYAVLCKGNWVYREFEQQIRQDERGIF